MEGRPLALVVGIVILGTASGAFDWTSPKLFEVTGCVGGQATLLWSFETDIYKDDMKLFWYHFDDVAASLYKSKLTKGSRYANRMTSVQGNMAAIKIEPLVLEDMGVYTLNVTFSEKDKGGQTVDTFRAARAYLSVGEPPDGELTIQHEPTTDDLETCSLERRVTLSCGPFKHLGVPPVTVEWMDPAGQVLKSSRYIEKNGRFYLDLPRRALSGNYSCRLEGRPHVLECLPENSTLRKPPPFYVSRDMTTREGCDDPVWDDDEDSGVIETLTQNVTDLQASLAAFQGEWETFLQNNLPALNNKFKALEKNLSSVGSLNEDNNQYVQAEINKLSSDVGQLLRRVAALESRPHLNVSDMDLVERRGSAPADDPLTKTLTPTWKIDSPKSGTQSTQLTSLVLTESGVLVAGELDRPEIVTSEPGEPGSVQVRETQKHGTEVRSVSSLPSGMVAVVVESYIFIADVMGDNPTGERWLSTDSSSYYGSAARTEDTLFLGKRPDKENAARIVIVSLGIATAEVQSTLMTYETTPQLESPDYLTMYDNQLYVSDWITHHIIRLDLDSGAITVWRGPLYNPHGLQFFQPRQSAFDSAGNMYLATGGNVCGYHGGAGHYSRGFCVLMIAKQGGWKIVAEKGKDNYPYGVAVTDDGIAVTWVSWSESPQMASSFIQGYQLVDPE